MTVKQHHCLVSVVFQSLTDAYRTQLRAQLPPALLLSIITQAAEAMDYLRLQGIVHRDARAANFLVESETPLSVVVADFGLAHCLDDVSTSAVSAIPWGPICKRMSTFNVASLLDIL